MRLSPYRNQLSPLRQFQFPENAFTIDDEPALSSSGLSVLLALEFSAQASAGQRLKLTAKQSIRTLEAYTGLSSERVKSALHELESDGLIHSVQGRKAEGRYGSSTRTLLQDGMPAAKGADYYFPVPRCLLETSMPWALSALSGSEVKLLLSLFHAARKLKSNRWTDARAAFRRMSGLSKPTFNAALKCLCDRGWIAVEEQRNQLSVALCDPRTRIALWQLEANHEDAGEFDIDEHPANFNVATMDEFEQLVASMLPDGWPIAVVGTEVQVRCPHQEHEDSNPSCYVSHPKMCYFCHGCGKNGSILAFAKAAAALTRTRPVEIPRSPKIEHLGNLLSEHPFRDRSGWIVKRLCRYEHGKRLRGKTKARLLYNLDRLDNARTVILVEGPRDADTVTNLELRDADGWPIIATTSGGAQSWRDEYASDLKGKRVIVMPDSDDAGLAYMEKVIQSLQKHGVEYCDLALPQFSAKDGSPGKDITQFVEAGHTAGDVLRILRGWCRNWIEPESLESRIDETTDTWVPAARIPVEEEEHVCAL